MLKKNNNMEFIKKYWKLFIGIVGGLFLLYLIIFMLTPKPDMSELDKYKLEQLDKNINLLIENQKKLDKQIEGYKKELSHIDSTISKVQNQKVIIKEYYKEQGDKISEMKPSEIDKLFHERYKY
jgi:septal ring factor EnvC (AmiA/AmiB activator)